MMLHRSSSSRRRRPSRSVANSPQEHSTSMGALGPPYRGRRASVASTEASDVLAQTFTIDRERSPRGSVVPNISLDTDNDVHDESHNRRILPNPDHCSRLNLSIDIKNRSPRNSLVPDPDYFRSSRTSLLSPRNSLTPEIGRSPRNSMVPEVSRSPRHSIAPDVSLSPRNSLVPGEVTYNRSPRNSLTASSSVGSRPLMSENGLSRSPRHSLAPEPSRSPRGSIANVDFDRTPRGSICPMDMPRLPRASITPQNEPLLDRSPGSEYISQSPRGSIQMSEATRYQRGSIGMSEINRSPRGSICPDTNLNRSPRGSIGKSDMPEKLHRGSLGSEDDRIPKGPEMQRSPRGSVGPELERSPRGSLGGISMEKRMSRSGQDHRRISLDQNSTKVRSVSPTFLRETKPASIRSEGTSQVNLGQGSNYLAWADSRRASSSVSQFSADESRRLFSGGSASAAEKGAGSSSPMGVATYGSLVFQLKDAHFEANGTCDFVYRALRVVSKTVVVTICLACLSTMPVIMFILGLQFIRDCPKEPNIPIYMVVGGALGGIRMFWSLYAQVRSRRPEVMTVPETRSYISPTKLVSVVLSCFLLGWFVLGNFWILGIMWPEYKAAFFDPRNWCSKTLYIFALIHLCVVYAVLIASLLTGIGLAFCRILACPWPERYK